MITEWITRFLLIQISIAIFFLTVENNSRYDVLYPKNSLQEFYPKIQITPFKHAHFENFETIREKNITTSIRFILIRHQI